MGIPFYFYVITRTHPGILIQRPPLNPQGLYLDFNGAIYQAVRKLEDAKVVPINDERVAAETCVYLTWLVDTVGGRLNEIGVCLDGVAPRAKMMQQRKRRYMGMFRSMLEKDAGLAPPKPAWDTCAITPGTAFMGTMATHLRDHCKTVPGMWVSPADEPGEGEHKIFARLATSKPGPALIYGLDADLIMLSLVSHRPEIYLMREPTQAGVPGIDPKSTSPFLYVNIDALRAGILATVRQHYRWPVTEEAMADPYCDEAKMWIETYIVLCFLLGNDFLPPLPALTLKSEGLETLLQAYGRLLKAAPGSSIIAGGAGTGGISGGISWDVLASLLEDLAKDEDNRVHGACVANVERRSHAREPMDLIEFFPSVPQNRDPVATSIATGTAGANWRLTYYMGLFDARRVNVPQVMRESTLSYLMGISWVFNYYTRRPKEPKWFYPYGYAPTVRDLSSTLQAEKAMICKRLAAAASSTDKEFVEPPVQLLSIIPPSSVNLLPPAARALMTGATPGCIHMYPDRFKVHTFLKMRLWECHPKLPVLDVDWIEKCYYDNK